MRTKKLTAYICTFLMLVPVFAAPVAVNASIASEQHLIINDNFGEGDFCGWKQTPSAEQIYDCEFDVESIGDGNYALTYESNIEAHNANSDWRYEVIEHDLSDYGINFVENVDTVIKTRVKQRGTGRSFLKMNAVLSSPSDEWNFNWGTLFYNTTGECAVPGGWRESGYMNANVLTQNTGVIDTWLNVEVTIHGTSKTASYVISNDDGTKIDTFTRVSIDYPDAASWEEDVLRTVAFRLRTKEKLYVDYVKVWQNGVKVTDISGDAGLNEVKVTFSSNGTGLNDLSEFTELYEEDGITLVPTSKSYDRIQKTVILKPQSTLDISTNYKVKINTAALEEKMQYVYETASELVITTPLCAAENLVIEGELIPGTKLRADYDIRPENAVENGSEVAWYSVDGDELTYICSGAEFDVTEDYVDSVITYSVIPAVILDGEEKTGVITYSADRVTPLSVPVVSNLLYDKNSAMIGVSLTASYDYYDADGDEENGTDIIWYKGTAADSNDYTEIARGENIIITEDYDGSYIKFAVIPKNNAGYRNVGELVESLPIGPVQDILSASNMVQNGDFETGSVSPWVLKGDWKNTPGAMVAYSDDKYEGNYCMKLIATPNPSACWQQAVSVQVNKTYLISFMAKAVESASVPYEGYVWTSIEGTRPYREEEVINAVKDDWTRVIFTYIPASTSINVSGARYGLNVNDAMLIDNYYFGELIIKDIETCEPETVTIPTRGEEKVTVAKNKIINQFDTTNGLKSEKVELFVEAPGVYTSGNDLVVTNRAVAGDIDIKVRCNPNMPGVADFEKTITVTLIANSNTKPEVSDVKISGDVKQGSTLSLSYDFYQVDGKADISEYQWLYSESENGQYNNIEGATAATYTVSEEYKDKFIKCMVLPKAENGETGLSVLSNFLVKNTPPYATDVKINGEWYVGGTLSGQYKYFDINGDEEAGSTYKWLICDEQNGVYDVIEGENTDKLVLTGDMADKYIKFSVTPANNAQCGTGNEAVSAPYVGPVRPQAKDVKISVNGSTYTGSYTYYHPHNLNESGTTFGWYLNDSLVSNSISYTATFVGNNKLTFKVTPSCEKAPEKGETVSFTINVNGTGAPSAIVGGTPGNIVSGGGFSGGGSGGASSGGANSSNEGFQSGVASINDMEYDKTESKQEIASDISSHWGKGYIEDMVSRGVMEANADGNYEPDSIISRKDMITFIFKALKLEKTEYSGGFADVSAGDEFSGYLQTLVDNGTIAKYEVFRPGDSITREEMCKILYISLENAGKLEKTEENKIEKLEDYAEISDWAREYVNTIYSFGIMIGVSDSRFAPAENVTKAQVATMLTRILAYIEGGK